MNNVNYTLGYHHKTSIEMLFKETDGVPFGEERVNAGTVVVEGVEEDLPQSSSQPTPVRSFLSSFSVNCIY